MGGDGKTGDIVTSADENSGSRRCRDRKLPAAAGTPGQSPPAGMGARRNLVPCLGRGQAITRRPGKFPERPDALPQLTCRVGEVARMLVYSGPSPTASKIPPN
jgi:hypothetical protein